MSTGEKLAHGAVILAARLLPIRIRDRYREQWLADLRDATSIGVRASEIAVASLVFAATVPRPFAIGLLRPTAEVVARRGVLAAGLALSAALLGLSRYASTAGTGESLSGNSGYDAFYFFTFTLFGLYALVAPVLALVAVSFTRETNSKVRLAVWLLVPVGLAQPAQAWIDLGNYHFAWDYNSPGAASYLIGLALTGAAVFVLRGSIAMERSDHSRRVVAGVSIGGAVATAAFVGAGFLASTALWAARVPLRFGLPRTTADGADFRDWLILKHFVEQQVGWVFSDWLLGGVVVVLLVFIVAERTRSMRAAIAVASTAVSAAVVAIGALFGFLDIVEAGTVAAPAVGLVLFVGRLGLIAAIFYGLQIREALPWVNLRRASA